MQHGSLLSDSKRRQALILSMYLVYSGILLGGILPEHEAPVNLYICQTDICWQWLKRPQCSIQRSFGKATCHHGTKQPV